MTGKDVKKLRKKLGMKIIDLAVEIDCAPNTIWRWETGRSSIRPVYAKALKRLMEERNVRP